MSEAWISEPFLFEDYEENLFCEIHGYCDPDKCPHAKTCWGWENAKCE